MSAAVVATPPANQVHGMDEFPELFEGPEKTLTLCFKPRRVAGRSLRLVPQEAWTEILKHAKCEILSAVNSNTVVIPSKDKEKTINSKGVTAYLLSESSLFVTDNSVVLKTCGRTTPLLALEPILDLAVPNWRKKDPEHYLKYATFMRLGYMRPDEQIEPHTSWEQEVQYMERHFRGEEAVMGTEHTSKQHVYVANYVPKGEIIDAFSTQVALTNLHTDESMRKFGTEQAREHEDKAPLKNRWQALHGDDRRAQASKAVHDECFFEPIGYSANGVFGRNFTTVHITPQPGCSYLSLETSVAMNKEARQRFTNAAVDWCTADTVAVTEFSLSPQLLQGCPPEVPGCELKRSTRTSGTTFACAHHHYERVAPSTAPVGSALSQVSTLDDDNSSCASVGDCSTPRTLDSTDVSSDTQQTPIHTYMPEDVKPGMSPSTHVAEQLLKTSPEIATDAPLALLDIDVLRQRADLWFRHLPRVEPFYAVKCNPNTALLNALWQLWQERGVGGFDCASPAEMKAVATLQGVDLSDRVVYANPCKQVSALTTAKALSVERTVFDNVAELEKIAATFPSAKLLLRVQTDDSKSQCPMSNKFGCATADAKDLLEKARSLNLEVVGVSFHVGSGCSEVGAFRGALTRAKEVFDEAKRQGLNLTLLDVGGGFPGADEEGSASFSDHAKDICELLQEHFADPKIRIIAEPGRFFAAASQALLTTVVSKAESSKGSRYYLNDGLYGAFNCLLYDHAHLTRPTIIRDGRDITAEAGENEPCTLFGPTCDGFDVVSEEMQLPNLKVGDRLLFHDMGAYTTAASTSFNGFSPAQCVAFKKVEA